MSTDNPTVTHDRPEKRRSFRANPDAPDVAGDLMARIKGESPQAANSIGMLRVMEGDMMEVTVAEIRAACATNKDHAKAKDLLAACSQLPPNHKVVVEKVDLEALLTNKQVVHYQERGEVASASGEATAFVPIQRKALEDDPNIKGKVVSKTPFN